MNTQEVLKNTSWQIHENNNQFSIDKMINDVLSFDKEWYLDESRQKGTATHKDTKMYQIRFFSYEWDIGDDEVPKQINSFNSKEANQEFSTMCAFLENFYEGKVVRAEVISMSPKSDISPHVDSGTMLNLARRVHIPLVTSEDVLFTVFNKTVNMKVGNWYEINNYLPHSVINKSNKERIHIILDILPKKYFRDKE